MKNFDDKAVARKLAFQIAQKGCAIHFDRYICFVDLDDSYEVEGNFEETIYKLAKMHYEADFIIGTKSDELQIERDPKDDNIYIVEGLNLEHVEFLIFKAAVTIAATECETLSFDDIEKKVINGLKRDTFKRDETTKVAYFKITSSNKK